MVSLKLKSIENCLYFLLALNESTDIRDTSQLLIFICTIDETFTVLKLKNILYCAKDPKARRTGQKTFLE